MSKRSAMLEYGQKRVAVNLCLSRGAIARLDALAQSIGTSRSDAIEQLVRDRVTVVPDAEVDQSDEVIRINATITPDTAERLKQWSQALGSNRSDMLERLVMGQMILRSGMPIHHEGQYQLNLALA